MTMEKIKGIKLQEFPLKEVKKAADLIYFEGPLLSLMVDQNEDQYFYYWCDSNESYHRWLAFRVLEKNKTDFLEKKISLRILMGQNPDEYFYSFDLDNDARYSNIRQLKKEELPESYFPEGDSYYEFDPVYFPPFQAPPKKQRRK